MEEIDADGVHVVLRCVRGVSLKKLARFGYVCMYVLYKSLDIRIELGRNLL